MKVRLTNEGGYPKVVDAETGEMIKYVTSADIHMGTLEVTAALALDNPEIDIMCEATVRETTHLVYDANDLDSITAAITLLISRRIELERL